MPKSFDMFKELENLLITEGNDFKNLKAETQNDFFIKIFKQLIIDIAEDSSISTSVSDYTIGGDSISNIITIFRNIDNTHLDLQHAINDFIEVIYEISYQLNEEQNLHLDIIRESLDSHRQLDNSDAEEDIFDMEDTFKVEKDISSNNQSSSRTPYLTAKEIKIPADQDSSTIINSEAPRADQASSAIINSEVPRIDIALAIQRVRLDSEHLSYEPKMSGSIEPSYRSSLTIAEHYHHIDDLYSANFIDSIGIYNFP
ncbi:MAG: hypothetical protein WBJ81_04095 [Rickettsiales bacterium]